MSEPARYLLGMEPAEVQRLERQHSVWRDVTTRVWELAGFGPGQTVVDLGCGPGFASLDLARLVEPAGRVIAIDSSPQALTECRRLVDAQGLENVEVCQATVTRVDVSGWNAAGVFARWLFSYLSDPEAAVQALGRGLRPGCCVAIMDYWNYLAIQTEPRSPLFEKAYQAVYRSIADRGGSFDVTGKLPRMFTAAGFAVRAVEPFCRVGRPGSPLWSWLSEFQQLHLPSLATMGYLTGEELEAFFAWWERLTYDADALLFAPPVLGVVAVKDA